MLLFRRSMSCLASVLRYSEFGDPGKVVKIGLEELPDPDTDKVLVEILLSPINPADINTIQGDYKITQVVNPFIINSIFQENILLSLNSLQFQVMNASQK